MAVRYYDEALTEKIKKWVHDPNMRILSPDSFTQLIQLKANDNKDKPITLPMITISRKPSLKLGLVGKKPLTFSGKRLEGTETEVVSLRAIPIELEYQVDIYTKEYIEGDEYLREFIYRLTNEPKMKIIIPYNDSNIEYDSYLRLMPNVEDNSDIQQRLFKGQFTRWTLNVTIDDAYLFSVPYKEVNTIESDNVSVDGIDDESDDDSIEVTN